MVSFKALVAFAIIFLAGSGKATLKDHCSDVSFWDVIKYKTEARQCCSTTPRQQCTLKSENVCLDVTEMQCNVVAGVECSVETKPAQAKKCEVVYKDYPYKSCEDVEFKTAHTKQVPECKNVTKNNCVTDWEVDANGNKVWAGSESCTPVTWEECKIVTKQVDFQSVKTECRTVSHLKYADFEQRTSESLEMDTTCQVKSGLDCSTVTVNKCTRVEWQECSMKPEENCSPVYVHQPEQEKVHQKKCLT